jgi:hypothetical protein
VNDLIALQAILRRNIDLDQIAVTPGKIAGIQSKLSKINVSHKQHAMPAPTPLSPLPAWCGQGGKG